MEDCPWRIIRGNKKREARLESIWFALGAFDYPRKGSTGQRIDHDPAIVTTTAAE